MTTLKSLTAATAAALLASVCSAQAGDRLKRAFGPWECYGLVTVGQDQHANPSKKWSTITHNDALRYALKYGERAFDGTDPPPMVVCRFRTASKLGQRTFAEPVDGAVKKARHLTAGGAVASAPGFGGLRFCWPKSRAFSASISWVSGSHPIGLLSSTASSSSKNQPAR
jgi:hypothetical protein